MHTTTADLIQTPGMLHHIRTSATTPCTPGTDTVRTTVAASWANTPTGAFIIYFSDGTYTRATDPADMWELADIPPRVS